MPRLKNGSANPGDIHVGQKVRMFRLAAGFSQEKLGDALDITFQQVQKYEKGVNRIGAGRLRDIARILSVPISAFYDGLDQPSSSEASVNAAVLQNAATRDGVRVLTALAKLSNTHRRNVVILVENIAELLGQ